MVCGKVRSNGVKRNRKPHKNLEVWKLSIDFVKDIYTLTTNFPDEEKFGIISQLRRAVVSIPTNIAEGAARSTKRNLVTLYDSLLTAYRSLLTMFTAYRSLLTIALASTLTCMDESLLVAMGTRILGLRVIN